MNLGLYLAKASFNYMHLSISIEIFTSTNRDNHIRSWKWLSLEKTNNSLIKEHGILSSLDFT